MQTQQDAKGEYFRLVAEQGHYAGRTVPSATRQGQYAFAADGTLLASVNTRDADAMLGMMRQALERWEALAADERGQGIEVGCVGWLARPRAAPLAHATRWYLWWSPLSTGTARTVFPSPGRSSRSPLSASGIRCCRGTVN